MIGIAVVAAGLAGGGVGWFAGMLLCPDPGDIGIGLMPWCVGGALIGAALAGGVAAEVLA